MSRYLLVSRSADFEARLEAMLGSALTSVSGDRLKPGLSSAVARTIRRPSVAILGPLLNYEETRELSLELTGRYPGMAVLPAGSASFAPQTAEPPVSKPPF